jgi:hypothetical protein
MSYWLLKFGRPDPVKDTMRRLRREANGLFQLGRSQGMEVLNEIPESEVVLFVLKQG